LKIKSPLLAAIALILSLGGLCIPAFLAQREGTRNLFLVVPAELNSPRINLQKIEEFSESEFLLSYEILSAEKASLSHADFPVTVIGTTSSYSQLLGLEMPEGSFFSKQAWTGKQRHAVLNEKAAFNIFGSNSIAGSRFRIRNDTWIVSGVVRDNDEDRSRIYVPSSIFGGEANTLLALMNPSGTIDEAYVKNSLKILGIREGAFDFFNLRTQTRLLWERALVIPLIFLSLFFLSLLRPLIRELMKALSVLRKSLDRHYTVEIFLKHRKLLVKPVFFALALVMFPCFSLFLFLRLASICLLWQDVPSLAVLNRDLFYPHIIRLNHFELASRALFILALILLAVFFVCFNIYLIRRNQHTSP
jgi:hypothetical protein